MAYKVFSEVPIKAGNPKLIAYEGDDALAAAGVTAWYLVPPEIRGISCAVLPAGGATAELEVYVGSVAEIKAGSEDTNMIESWPAGAVAVYSSDRVDPVAAIRMRQTGAGTSKMRLRAQ